MRPNVFLQRLPHLVALVAIASAPGCADERSGPATGSLDGKCYPNGTCDEGLLCQDNGTTNICVEAPAEGSIGGVCYGNGTCDPGLICNGSTCEADTTLPVGTLGAACYGNGTCMGPDLICVADICEVNNAPRTGLLGGACYDNGSCNPGLLCNSGVCEEDDTIPSGELGGSCLVNGTCREGLLCNGTVCEVDDTLQVGTVGAACFPNGTCNAGLECIVTVTGGESHAECAVEEPIDFGALDQPCWPNNTCNGGLVCDLGTCVDNDSAITEPPGADGGLCYHNGTCNDGLVCNSFGVCEPIVDGALGGACIGGSSCNLGLSCYDGVCSPTIEHLGSIHGVVTDYITNARLENVQVTLIHLGGVEQTVSDALGYYQFDDLLPGHFEVTFASLDDTHPIRRLRDVTVTCNNDVASTWHYGDFCADYDCFEGSEHWESGPAWWWDQDRHCNQIHDIRLYPLTGHDSCTIYYVGDEEIVPAAGVQVVADYSGICANTEDECKGEILSVRAEVSELVLSQSCSYSAREKVDISPDRFIYTTDESGVVDLSGLPNTGKNGYFFNIMPSSANGIDYETKRGLRLLDVWEGWGDPYADFDWPGGPGIPGGDHDHTVQEGACEVFLQPTERCPFIMQNNWEDQLYGAYDVTEPVEFTFSRAMKSDTCHIALCKLSDNNHTPTDNLAGCSEVTAEVEWSEDETAVTITPASRLLPHTKYGVQIAYCESRNDDQNYCSPMDNYDWSRHTFITEEGLEFLSGPLQCGEGSGKGTVDPEANLEFVFSQALEPTDPSTSFEFFRVLRDYPEHHDPELGTCDSVREFPLPATFTTDGNVLIVDPDDTLVAGAEYHVRATVCSAINCVSIEPAASGEGRDKDCPSYCVQADPEDKLWFLFADVPVTGPNHLTLLDPTANITLTFSKEINPALSVITIEDADGFVDHDNEDQSHDMLTSVFTVDGNNAILDPATDLVPGEYYTVRYQAFASDEQGYANGHFTFWVADEPITIAFVDDNLGDGTDVHYHEPIELIYSADVDGWDPDGNVNDHHVPGDDNNRTLVQLFEVDDEGNEVFVDIIDSVWTDGTSLFIDAALKPDTTYVAHVKAYADDVNNEAPLNDPDWPDPNHNGFGSGIGVYVQHVVTFTTHPHITLASASFGTYTDSNDDGFWVDDDGNDGDQPQCSDEGDVFDCGDFQGSTDFPANGTISLTFTLPPDESMYHEVNFVRLYRQTNEDNLTTAANFDLVATTNTVDAATSTVTLALLTDETLQDGGTYCVAYQVTSNILEPDGNYDISEYVGGNTDLAESGALHDDDPQAGNSLTGTVWSPEMCFQVAGEIEVDPEAPPAAPTLELADQVDGGDTDISLRWNLLIEGGTGGVSDGGTRWYEIYVAADDGDIEDYLLWRVFDEACDALTEDCTEAGTPNAALGQTFGPTTEIQQVNDQSVCDGDSAPVFCGPDGMPFADQQSVFFRIRACTGSVGTDVNPLCGPYSPALEVFDNTGPLVVGVLQVNFGDESTIASADTDANIADDPSGGPASAINNDSEFTPDGDSWFRLLVVINEPAEEGSEPEATVSESGITNDDNRTTCVFDGWNEDGGNAWWIADVDSATGIAAPSITIPPRQLAVFTCHVPSRSPPSGFGGNVGLSNIVDEGGTATTIPAAIGQDNFFTLGDPGACSDVADDSGDGTTTFGSAFSDVIEQNDLLFTCNGYSYN